MCKGERCGEIERDRKGERGVCEYVQMREMGERERKKEREREREREREGGGGREYVQRREMRRDRERQEGGEGGM